MLGKQAKHHKLAHIHTHTYQHDSIGVSYHCNQNKKKKKPEYSFCNLVTSFGMYHQQLNFAESELQKTFAKDLKHFIVVSQESLHYLKIQFNLLQ